MSIPTGDKPDEAAERAKFISDLRALADMLENEPQLPIPYVLDGTAFVDGTDAEKVAAVFQAAELLGTEVTFDRANGVCQTIYTRGKARYCVYASVGKESQTGKVTVASPADVLGAPLRAAELEHVPTALLREAAEQVLNGELFPVGEPVVHAAFYSPHGPGNSNRGCCDEYGTVTQDPDAVTCPRCLALADTPAGEPSC